MRLFLSLPVLALVLFMALQGSAPAQAAPDDTSTWGDIPGKVKELKRTVEEKIRSWFDKIKEKFKDTFSQPPEDISMKISP